MGFWRPGLGLILFAAAAFVMIHLAYNLAGVADKVVEYTASDDVAKMIFSAGNSSGVYVYENGTLVRNESILQEYDITYTKYTSKNSEWFSLPLLNFKMFARPKYMIMLLAFFMLLYTIAKARGGG